MFHKNWIQCYYKEPGQFTRQSPDDKFIVNYECVRNTKVNLYTESLRTVQKITEGYPNEKFSLLFSGGLESEIMVRSFQEASVPFHVYIGRYENDINLYDVSYAITICESRQIPYTIIDFQLKKFLEKDSIKLATTIQCSEARLLPQLALSELVPHMPIMANGEPAPRRLSANYDEKSIWVLDEDENFWSWARYFAIKNRPAIPEWCRYTPELYNSWMNLRWFNLLINDKIYGKTSAWSSKLTGYREAYSDLLSRKKLTGFEKVEPLFNELNAYLDVAMPSQISYLYTVDDWFKNRVYNITEPSTKLYRKL